MMITGYEGVISSMKGEAIARGERDPTIRGIGNQREETSSERRKDNGSRF